MVSVELIVNNFFSLVRKSQSGNYFSSTELTNYFQAIQNTLFEYYMTQKNKGSKDSVDALQPFLKSATLTFTNGVSPFPSDYFHSDTCLYRWILNSSSGIITQDIPVPYITQSEYSVLVRDGNRKPNILKQRVYYSFLNNQINIYPSSVTNSEFIYYRPPADAVYATITQSTPLGTTQVFDPLTSVNFEWNASQQENIESLLLFFSGISIRENDIVQYAKMKQHEQLIG